MVHSFTVMQGRVAAMQQAPRAPYVYIGECSWAAQNALVCRAALTGIPATVVIERTGPRVPGVFASGLTARWQEILSTRTVFGERGFGEQG